MILQSRHLEILKQACNLLAEGFPDPYEGPSTTFDETSAKILRETAIRLRENLPYQEPLYLGQMLKPPHPLAHLSYSLAMCLNPNNHAYDGGRSSSEMEKECVREIAQMFGWTTHLGHLCGGGTIANFEALWVARELTAGGPVFASSQAHYTHERLSGVLQVPFFKVPVDARGRMDPQRLEAMLRNNPPGTVVATAGTTALGAVDPGHDLLPLREKYGFRLHIDAAYGGYYRLVDTLDPETAAAFAAIADADSVVIDPHKHGLQPYGCGCVLFRDPGVGRIYHHESPYTYFTSDELHLGEISLECSRAGAAAVALWSTMRRFPLTTHGEFSQMLRDCREAAVRFADVIRGDSRFRLIMDPQLDIVVWGVRAETAGRSTELAAAVFYRAAELGLHLALARFPRSIAERSGVVDVWDREELTCLRSCLMKPEHLACLPRIETLLSTAADDVITTP